MTYKRYHSDDLTRPLKEIGPVLYWEKDGRQAAVFVCKCGQREMYLAKHKISFDENDVMTVSPSLLTDGYIEGHGFFVCHSFIKNGEMKMCADSTCPGMSENVV